MKSFLRTATTKLITTLNVLMALDKFFCTWCGDKASPFSVVNYVMNFFGCKIIFLRREKQVDLKYR